MVSSVVTAEEYLVYPFRLNNNKAADAFFLFQDYYDMDLIPIEEWPC